MDVLRGRTRGGGARRAAGGGARALGETDGTGAKKRPPGPRKPPNLRAAARTRGAGRALAHDACPTRTRVVVNVAGGHIVVAGWRESGGKSRLQPRRTRGCFQWRPALRARRWLVGRCLVGKRVPRHACAVRGARGTGGGEGRCGTRGGRKVCVISQLVNLFFLDPPRLTSHLPHTKKGEMAGEGIRVGLNKGESNAPPNSCRARLCRVWEGGKTEPRLVSIWGRRRSASEERAASPPPSLSLSRASPVCRAPASPHPRRPALLLRPLQARS
jgi:hypothetical protein